jgi:outer membrane protein TolC
MVNLTLPDRRMIILLLVSGSISLVYTLHLSPAKGQSNLPPFLPLRQLQVTQPVAPLPSSPSVQPRGKSVSLSLADVINLLLQNNRDLKNAALDRIVQQQQLREARSAFTPQVQPVVGIGISQFLSNAGISPSPASLSSITVGGFGSTGGGTTEALTSRTTLNYTTQLSGRIKTPIGTTLTVTVDPFQTQKVGVTLSQPLLRGSGIAINMAPVKKAELNETRNQLELAQILIEKITEASAAYRAIARAQEALAIQRLSLENQRQQQEIIQILVNSGRRSRAELVDIEGNIAATQTQRLTAQNTLEQAKANLLNLLDLEEKIDIIVPQTLIDEFKADTLPSDAIERLNLDNLLQTAYARRTDYQRGQLATQIAALDLRVAQDNQRWGLDLVGNTTFGDTSQAAAGILLTRVFQDQSLVTTFQQARVEGLKRTNDLANLKDTIRLEVESRYRDVLSARDRIASTRKARELAAQRLEIAQVKFKRGRDGVDIFQVLTLQNNLVNIQNEEVNAKIDFLDALTRLEQAIGTTLDTWKVPLNISN